MPFPSGICVCYGFIKAATAQDVQNIVRTFLYHPKIELKILYNPDGQNNVEDFTISRQVESKMFCRPIGL